MAGQWRWCSTFRTVLLVTLAACFTYTTSNLCSSIFPLHPSLLLPLSNLSPSALDCPSFLSGLLTCKRQETVSLPCFLTTGAIQVKQERAFVAFRPDGAAHGTAVANASSSTWCQTRLANQRWHRFKCIRADVQNALPSPHSSFWNQTARKGNSSDQGRAQNIA